jgi:hypothetical protein
MAKRKKSADSYYRPVRGSRELSTRDLADHELRAIESLSGLSKNDPVRLYAGEWLGRAKAYEASVSLPPEVFDELASRLTPLEQTIYYQLLRLSLGEGRNFCRVGKRELIARTGISERRLLVALDGLVRKERIKALHRNNFGTLYRVFLPGESPALSAPEGAEGGAVSKPITAKTSRVSRRSPEKEEGTTYYVDSSIEGRRPPGRRIADVAGVKAAGQKVTLKGSRPRSRPLESPLNEERFAGVSGSKGPSITLDGIVKQFFRQVRRKPTLDEKDEATSEVTALLEDGYTRDEVLTAVRWFGKHFPREKSLGRLPYHIHEALSEGKPGKD